MTKLTSKLHPSLPKGGKATFDRKMMKLGLTYSIHIKLLELEVMANTHKTSTYFNNKESHRQLPQTIANPHLDF